MVSLFVVGKTFFNVRNSNISSRINSSNDSDFRIIQSSNLEEDASVFLISHIGNLLIFILYFPYYVPFFFKSEKVLPVRILCTMHTNFELCILTRFINILPLN